MGVLTRRFLLLWQGQLVSQLGGQAFLIATSYFILESTGSTTFVGVVMMASTAPLALLSPVAGVLADRYSRRSILIVTDLVRAAAIGSLGLLVLSPSATPHMTAFVLAAAVTGAMTAVFMPALQAFIPDVVDRDHLATANAVSQLSRQAAILVGQAAGGVLYARWGPGPLLMFNAASFGYAALATWFIREDPRSRLAASSHAAAAYRQYLDEARAGLAYLRQQTNLLGLLIVFGGVNLLFMPVFVLLPVYVRDVLRSGPEWYGWLLAASGAGALCGAGVAGLAYRRTAGERLMRFSIGGIACAVLALAVTNDRIVALAAFLGIGVLSSIVNVTVLTLVQSTIGEDMRGRVMAIVVAISTAAVPIGLAAGGAMGDIWRDSLRVVFGACGAAIALLITALTPVRSAAEPRLL